MQSSDLVEFSGLSGQDIIWNISDDGQIQINDKLRFLGSGEGMIMMPFGLHEVVLSKYGNETDMVKFSRVRILGRFFLSFTV